MQQPASLGKVQLVEKLEPGHWKQCGPLLMPMRCDTPWSQTTANHVYGQIALPPNHADQVGKIVFEVRGLDGTVLGTYPAEREVFSEAGKFARATAHWPSDAAPPGLSQVTAIVFDPQGKELTRVAPRLVSVNMQPGY